MFPDHVSRRATRPPVPQHRVSTATRDQSSSCPPSRPPTEHEERTPTAA